jgi:hypothetical protein
MDKSTYILSIFDIHRYFYRKIIPLGKNDAQVEFIVNVLLYAEIDTIGFVFIHIPKEKGSFYALYYP